MKLHLWAAIGILTRKSICGVISREYSSEWKPGDEPYYPVNDEKNGAVYQAYRELAAHEENVIFGGRLGEYKYYDMDKVIESALVMAKEELER